MTKLSLQGLWQTIGARGGAEFMVLPDRRVSYADLVRSIRQWLTCFDAHGVQPGDRIVIRTADEETMVAAFIGALLDGVVPVPLTADTPDTRAATVSANVEAALFLSDLAPADDALVSTTRVLSLSMRSAPAKNSWFGRGRPRDGALGEDYPPAIREPRLLSDEHDLAYVLFTSGTTLSPSGVMISRGNLFANLATLSRLFGYDQRSRIFNDMILAHADGIVQGPLLAAANGCAVVRAGGFQLSRLEEWLETVRRERATHVITVPTVWSLIDRFAQHDDYFDAPECGALLSVAAKLPDALWRRLENRFSRPVFNQYGLTETVASALYAGPQPEMGVFGTVGRPVDCEARIDPDASDQRQGELHLRGANVFTGYWRNRDRTAATFVSDGWMKTGDLARFRDDGSYEILGRLKTVIMTGGFLIRPDEIDEAMLHHPAVQESATVGITDELFDEVPVTAVVCREPIDEATLTAHARSLLEPRKVPKRIITVDAILYGDSGKAQIGPLRERMLAAMALPDGDPTVGDGADVVDLVMAVACDVFRVKPDRLSSRTGAGDVPGWDSFSQLTLLMAVEEALDIRVPASRVAAIRTLGDVVRIAKELKR